MSAIQILNTIFY